MGSRHISRSARIIYLAMNYIPEVTPQITVVCAQNTTATKHCQGYDVGVIRSAPSCTFKVAYLGIEVRFFNYSSYP